MLHYCAVIVLLAVTAIAAALGICGLSALGAGLILVHVVVYGKNCRQGMAKFGFSLKKPLDAW